jgi:hypothetical protein
MWVIVVFTLTAQLFVMSHVYDTKALCQNELTAGINRDAEARKLVRTAQCVEVVSQ